MAKHKRTYNTMLIKKTVSYSIYDIAVLFSVHKATVRQWIKDGLKKIDDRKPYLVNGADLYVYLKDRQAKKKRKCKPDQLYCCRCRIPQKSKENRVVITLLSQKTGRLTGLCIECGSRMNRIISLKKLNEFRELLIITTTHEKNIIPSGTPNVNTHLDEDVLT